MKKLRPLKIFILSFLLVLLPANIVMAKTNCQDNAEMKIKEKLNVDVEFVSVDHIDEYIGSNISNGEEKLLKSLEKIGVKGGRVDIIKKEMVPKDMTLLAFDTDDAAAKYISYNVDTFEVTALNYSTSLYTYTRNYSVHVEIAGMSVVRINARGTYYTDSFGYSRFTSVSKPWITNNGITLGLEIVLNNSWSSISASKTSANIGANYHTNFYLIVNGLIKVYSFETTTNKTITPLM